MSRQVVLSGKRKEDKEAMKGKFTGVGVGPGDPQLLTLKALHAIQESDVVAIPVSDSGLKKPGENADPKYMQQCTAYQIVRQVYSQIGEKEVIFLPMPMIKDREKLIEIHDEDAAFTAEKLNEGKDVVFLTIGDPSIYSTCMYIHKRLKRMGYETELIPGIPSFCAAAARLDISLSENSDGLHISFLRSRRKYEAAGNESIYEKRTENGGSETFSCRERFRGKNGGKLWYGFGEALFFDGRNPRTGGILFVVYHKR